MPRLKNVARSISFTLWDVSRNAYHSELEDELPEVDKYFGKFDMKAMVEELKVTYAPEYIYERKITTPSHFAYLKVSEGCNRFVFVLCYTQNDRSP